MRLSEIPHATLLEHIHAPPTVGDARDGGLVGVIEEGIQLQEDQ